MATTLRYNDDRGRVRDPGARPDGVQAMTHLVSAFLAISACSGGKDDTDTTETDTQESDAETETETETETDAETETDVETETETEESDVEPIPEWTADVQPIFADNCAGCHLDGGTSGSFNFDDGVSDLADVPSNGSSLDYVEPGDADNSYLIAKLSGTQVAAGGTGARMPFGGAALSADDLATIRAWINAGALP